MMLAAGRARARFMSGSALLFAEILRLFGESGSRQPQRVLLIDALSTNPHYPNRMRRVWLAILLAFALTASGVASAMAAQDCPMQSAATAAMNDCCPEDQGPSAPGQDRHEMAGCKMGMACRAAPAVTPSVAPIGLPTATASVSEPVLVEAATPSGPLQQLFRPPRTT